LRAKRSNLAFPDEIATRLFPLLAGLAMTLWKGRFVF
jgi:hypothetical protein